MPSDVRCSVCGSPHRVVGGYDHADKCPVATAEYLSSLGFPHTKSQKELYPVLITPAPGRIVHYTLTYHDAVEIERRRADARMTPHHEIRSGAQVHVGNPTAEGDIFPLLITKVWAATPDERTAVNGQVFLDGNDVLWVTSVIQGDVVGTWRAAPHV